MIQKNDVAVCGDVMSLLFLFFQMFKGNLQSLHAIFGAVGAGVVTGNVAIVYVWMHAIFHGLPVHSAQRFPHGFYDFFVRVVRHCLYLFLE